MVEVFKTNVCDSEHARNLIEKLGERSWEYKVNFDLTDKDRILRVQSRTDSINANAIIELLKQFGFEAEVLPD